MSDVKRYDLITTVSAGRLSQTDLVESKDGFLVEWNDYARLHEQVRYYAIEAKDFESKWVMVLEDYARLKAEVERLKKLGTEMGKHLPDTDAANRAYIDFEMGGQP